MNGMTGTDYIIWVFRIAALGLLCVSAYHDAKTREIADIYTGLFALCCVVVGFLTGEVSSAIAGLIIAGAFLLLPDLAGFGGADGIVYAGILAMFGYKAFPVFLLASCAFALAAWVIKKGRKPASPSLNIPSEFNLPPDFNNSDAEISSPSIPSPSIVDAPDSDDSGSVLKATETHDSEAIASPSVPLPCGSDNPKEEVPANEVTGCITGCEREEGIKEAHGKGESGEEEKKEETGEEEAGIAMLPMILSSCLVAIPITYLVWLPFLESI